MTPLETELLNAATLALPYVEDAERDGAYKPGAVAHITATIRAAIDKATADQEQQPSARQDPAGTDWTQQPMSLPELLAAILRRAERGRSYGRLMTSSKDICLDDVIRLAERALLLANDQHKAAAS